MKFFTVYFARMIVITLLTGLSLGNAQMQKNPLLRGQKQPVPVLVIAHRGASGYAPENTLPAFSKGIHMGAHMFELDVHLTRDGVPIVVHDDTLTRCSDVEKKFPGRAPYYVSDFTLDEIRQLDAGSWYVRELQKSPQERRGSLRYIFEEERKQFITDADWTYYQSGQVKHPTLEEVLLLAKEFSCLVNIEIKSIPRFYHELAQKVIRMVEQMNLTSQVIISSFDHYQVALCKKLNPGIATAILCGDRVFDPGRYCVEIVNADAFNPGCYGEADLFGFQSVQYQYTQKLELDAIHSARDMKVGVNVWTEDDPRRMPILIQAGVTGIFTNYPNRLLDVLKKLMPKEYGGQ